MADRATFEAAVAQLTTAAAALAAAAAANGDRFAKELADLQAAVANAQAIVPDGDVAAVTAAVAQIQTVVDALNVGAPAA